MSTAEAEPVTREPGLDDPVVSHMPEGRVYVGGDLLTALCGARLIGVAASDECPRCCKCEEEIEKIFGKNIEPTKP